METSKEQHLPVLQEGAKSLGSDLRPLTSSSRLAATYQATVDFTAGALGKRGYKRVIHFSIMCWLIWLSLKK